MIEFLCPGGHRLRCPEQQAGRAAKCPRCGVKFRIPDPSEAEVPESSESDPITSHPELTDIDSPKAPAAGGQGLADQEPQIEFLCPNGHRLHGAASLQGRPGECPECGSRFRIPSYDEVSEEEETEAEIGVGRADRAGESGMGLAEVEEVPGPPDRLRHPLARLFCRLWAEKAPGAAIELHLSDGQTVVPERFAPELSQESHGVFAVRDSGGSYTLTVVAWGSVVRVLVRGVGKLPKEMRD